HPVERDNQSGGPEIEVDRDRTMGLTRDDHRPDDEAVLQLLATVASAGEEADGRRRRRAHVRTWRMMMRALGPRRSFPSWSVVVADSTGTGAPAGSRDKPPAPINQVPLDEWRSVTVRSPASLEASRA